MTARTDETGAAFKGSQLQTQIYVNARTAALDDAIRGEFTELSGAELEWRSPLAADGYSEYQDQAFLDAVDLGTDLGAELRKFWPAGGPVWDALAVIKIPGSARPGVLLVEGKSYPEELYGGGSAATAEASVALIESSLEWTQHQLGAQGQTPQDWCGRLYQNANRLAHLQWLRSRGVRAWLAYLLFTDDPHGPTSADAWHLAIANANAELGLTGVTVPHVGHVLLPAGDGSELRAAT